MTTHSTMAVVEQVVGGHAALRAAVGTGILDRLQQAPADPGDLAALTGVDRRLLTPLLEVLAALGVVVPDGAGRFRTSPETTATISVCDRSFAGLAEALHGRPPPDQVDTAGGADARYPDAVGLIGAQLTAAAQQAAARLARPDLRILDAGAGGAPWSIAIVQQEPTCRVVAVDLPAVLATTRGAVAAAGVADRFDLLPADLFDLPLQPAHDLVIAGNLCHLFAPDRAAGLLHRLAGGLRPGGVLAVVDLPGDRCDMADLRTAVYALGLTLRTQTGGLHHSDDYRRWLAAAGLVEFDAIPLAPHGLHLFTSRRAG
jgi:SAM-dependent methyltransferase